MHKKFFRVTRIFYGLKCRRQQSFLKKVVKMSTNDINPNFKNFVSDSISKESADKFKSFFEKMDLAPDKSIKEKASEKADESDPADNKKGKEIVNTRGSRRHTLF